MFKLMIVVDILGFSCMIYDPTDVQNSGHIWEYVTGKVLWCVSVGNFIPNVFCVQGGGLLPTL